ncbi:MAG: [Fe-Fe] hydrogenase large subunit C-terminal domain-containing protein [Planctomycetota bacterium]|nr:4Fe-4S binding protein [Planctomycetota bacterium]MCX8039588.1 4Fe-4S binding protein [Planctomycetota bacterium]MDW8373121.1 [Fe-Fe] hydrogenase large subunit C-terminal domain-containing protein [Planctomycetota bacterium]
MERRAPVSTDPAQCQDCYRCLRACPVQAISVAQGHAQVRPEACIACGRCVAACPRRAKRVRDDLPAARAAVAAGNAIAALAPSWVAAFPGLGPERCSAALARLGFCAVSEVAVGASAVSAATAELLQRAPQRLWLSTACPAAVAWVRRHRPELVPALAPIASPAAVHARMLAAARPGCRVVLITPCIAKKREADAHPELWAAAISFADLARWWQEAGINPWTLPPGEPFLFAEDGGGRRYPLEGGMLQSLAARHPPSMLATVSGVDHFAAACDGLGQHDAATFVELSACSGGCIQGPGMPEGAGGLLRRRRAVLQAPVPEARGCPPAVDTAARWFPEPEATPEPDERFLIAALERIGKRRAEDEANCGGCGYEACRAFARAMCAGRAEPEQCVTWMRRLAQRQANALLTAMPAAAVLVDRQLRIIECNRHFVRLAGGEERASPGTALGGPPTLARLLRHVLDGGSEIVNRELRWGSRVLSASLFSVEPGQVAGAVLIDITEPAMGREQVAARAREAIEKHLATVQRIAYLLGENAAETEGLLAQIVDAYAAQDGDGQA